MPLSLKRVATNRTGIQRLHEVSSACKQACVIGLSFLLIFSRVQADQTMYDFSTLTLHELTTQLENTSTAGVPFITAFTQRLIDITYFERETSPEDREKGKELIDYWIPAFERLMEPHPSILEKYQNAYRMQLEEVRFTGVDSLAWKIDSPGVTGDQVLDLIVDPSSGPLIHNFISVMERTDTGMKAWIQEKPLLIRKLILQRVRPKENNAVLILSGLVSGYDQIAWNLLTEDERNAMLRVANDYESARDVLVKYDLVPPKSPAVPLATALNDDFLYGLIIHQLRQPFYILEDPLLRELYHELDDDKVISLLLLSLRLKLLIDLVEGTYGTNITEQVRKLVMEHIEKPLLDGFDSFLEPLENADNIRSGYGSDLTIAVAFSNWYIREDSPEDEQVTLTNAIVKILNYERVRALHIYRFILRYFRQYPPESGESPNEEYIRKVFDQYGALYETFGSSMAKAERQLLFEDWIGLWNR